MKTGLIVGFAAGVSRAEQNAILRAAGATSKKRFGQIDAVLVKVDDDDEATVAKVLSSDRCRARFVSARATGAPAPTRSAAASGSVPTRCPAPR